MRKENLQNIIKVLTFALIFFTTSLSAQNYNWSAAMGGIDNDRVHAVATDAAGNTFLCGSFKYTVDFDPGVNEHNVTSVGNYDVFVQKFTPAGELAWVKTFGSSAGEDAVDMKVDGQGNVYITGYFKKTVDFDPNDGVESIKSNGSSDIFLQKLDNDGNLVWVKTWGSTSIDEGGAIHIDNAGNIYTTGIFKYTVDFDLGDGTAELTAPGSNKNIFVQKLDNNGDFVWVKGIIGATAEAITITTDNAGNVYTGGNFTGTADFNPGEDVNNRTSHGLNDVFTQKLDANGDFVWVNTIEGTSDNTISDIAVSQDGKVFVTGTFNGTADFNTNGSIPANITSTGLSDGFIQKLDSEGELMFVKYLGGSMGDGVNAIAFDSYDQFWVTGYFHTSMMLDAAHGQMVTVGQEDVFVAGYDMNGNYITAFSYGGGGTDMGEQIVFSGNSIYTTGTFEGNELDFDIGIGVDKKSSNGVSDIFLQKLSFCISSDLPVLEISASEICTGGFAEFSVVGGELNSATQWVWREGSCTGNWVGEGTSITVTPNQSTTYYVSGEGGCVTNSECHPIELQVNETPAPDTVAMTLCQGETYTFPDGTIEVVETSYMQQSVLNSVLGCDSIINTALTVTPVSNTEESATVCQGESYTFPDGTIEVVETSYIHKSVFTSATGCDSIINTAITVTPVSNTEENASVCAGEFFTFHDGTVVENITEVTTHNNVFTSAAGCDSTIVQIVTPTMVSVDIHIDGNTLSTTAEDAEYQWIDCETEMPIADANESVFTPTQSGEYAVEVTIGNCTAVSTCESMSIVATSSLMVDKNIDVYPNPMTSTLNVMIGNSYHEGTVTLFHITGKRVYNQTLNGERQITVNVNDMIQGVYYLEVMTDGIPTITKVIK